MAAVSTDLDKMPVVRKLADFDQKSGNMLERLVFNNRLAMIVVCAIITVLLGYVAATKLRLNASFEKMLPQSQPYIKNYLTYQKDLRGLGNALRVVVENTDGDIFDPKYLEVLKQVNDALVLTPGVDRAWVKSLWMPGVRWTEVTEEGFRGGPVMPDSYNGSPQTVEQLKQNIARSGIVGSLVANNFKSSMIFVPLLAKEAATGNPIDYHGLSRVLDESIRDKYELAKSLEEKVRAHETPNVKIRVIGFAKLIGELITGLVKVMMFFGIAAIIATLIIYWYTRCVRSTALVIACSIVAVIWQLGLVALLGFELDPFSILVPFLVFAIGVSHGAQKMNGIMQDIGRGTHKLVAARYTFRRLFLAGLTALLADAAGVAVLILIDIPVIRDRAMTASIA
jgi:predicted RND superfamily exporter protein